MNGEHKQFLDAMEKISLQRHQENLQKFSEIFKRLNSLPCGERKGFFTYVKWHLGILTTSIAVIAGYLIRHLLKG